MPIGDAAGMVACLDCITIQAMPRAVRVFVFLILMLCALSCAAALPPLPHEAYIWQRNWTPGLSDAIDESQSALAGYRVLAAESDRSGSLQSIAPDLAFLLRQEQVPVTAVIRINGSDPPPDPDALSARVRAIVRDWKAAGISLAGIEIDHDCASARLGDYARLLHALHSAGWTPGLRLSITALPTWIGADALRDVLAQVDESVLQVHAVRAPASGLFDVRAARRWIDAYAAISPQPFRVSLPAYGVRVRFGNDGHALAIEAEVPREMSDGSNTRELRARPQEVAALLRELASARPAALAGIVWFRLPTQDDRRAWSIETLRAVIKAEPLIDRLQARVETGPDGASDIVLSNRGTLDATNASISVRGEHCTAADAVSGYRVQQEADMWHFLAPPDGILRAGRERRIGWMRCGNVEKVIIDEIP